MNEKRFYHTALEKELLSGKDLKAKIDAEIRSERTAIDLAKRKSGAPRLSTLQKWIAIPAAAVLLVLTLAAGALVANGGMRESHRAGTRPEETLPPMETPAYTETPGATEVPPMEEPPVSIEPSLAPAFIPTPPGPEMEPTPTPPMLTEQPTPEPTPLPSAMPKPTPTPGPTETPGLTVFPLPNGAMLPENVRIDEELALLYASASDETQVEVSLDIEADAEETVLAERERLETLGYALDVTAGSRTYRLTVNVGQLRSFPVDPSFAYRFGYVRIVPPSASTVPATEDTVDLCIWFRDDFTGDTALDLLKTQDAALYEAYLNGGPDELLQRAIERRREIEAEHFSAENRRKLASICDDNEILMVSEYSAMCIVRVPKDRLGSIENDPNVSRIEPFVNLTATGS